MIYVPDHFELYEVVPRNQYWRWKGKGDRAWLVFDERALRTIDGLRDKYGKVIINDWYWDGEKQLRGWRPFDTLLGAELSQHKFGRAFDMEFKYVTAEEVRRDIKAFPNMEPFQFITAVEDTVSWFHFDVRNWDRSKNGILFFNP